jgi:hypothetical protein
VGDTKRDLAQLKKELAHWYHHGAGKELREARIRRAAEFIPEVLEDPPATKRRGAGKKWTRERLQILRNRLVELARRGVDLDSISIARTAKLLKEHFDNDFHSAPSVEKQLQKLIKQR